MQYLQQQKLADVDMLLSFYYNLLNNANLLSAHTLSPNAKEYCEYYVGVRFYSSKKLIIKIGIKKFLAELLLCFLASVNTA